MTEQQLNATVHRLTRDHRTSHTDCDTGKTSYPTEMALFTQLRQEITSSSRPSTGASSGPRSPVALGAVVLWDEIRETLATMHIAITGKDEPATSPESKLQKWAAWTQADTSGNETQKCLHRATAWAAAIDQLINPVRRIDISGSCPAEGCGVSHAWTWDEDEYVRNTALTASGSEARCGACGATWVGAELHTLALELWKVAA
ncbi:hypothetical protein QFZ30_002450 [Arthrobacter pascens]|uniref:DUF7341 domain-containing protein n=1 Tax=Arthrobacter pascens TaxID=1677 RepID=UPI00278EB0EE|nr:hypothetical protein [Arthrobacter pascens]MDQ0679068.1 hypothetical protein [Arthrobacter pascens]